MPTLKDVAKEAGLTVTTVSRVLNNRGYISEKAREKVNKAMKTLNYQPNEVARSLSKKSTETIGVIVSNITHPYFSAVISAIEACAETYNYKILLYNTNNDLELEESYMDRCRGNQVEGILLYSGIADNKYLSNIDVPVVTMERYQKGAKASVEMDNYQGGLLAGQHLISQGCRQIVHISAIYENDMPADERENGFIDACKAEKVEHEIIHIPATLNVHEDFGQLADTILEKSPGVDGIFAGSDIIAAQLVNLLIEKGKHIPNDIKVIGYDDIYISTYIRPKLTTIHQPIKEATELAVELLMKAIRKEPVPLRTKLAVSLVLREST